MDHREISKFYLITSLGLILFLLQGRTANAQTITITNSGVVSISATVPGLGNNLNTGGSSGGGGGGGGSMGSADVEFTGKAYPGSLVTLLKDASVVSTVRAQNDAAFSLSVPNITSGTYLFSLFSEDYKGNRSSLVTFPVVASGIGTTYISNIFIAPTIAADKSEVRQGDPIALFGQSTPGADIQISVHSTNERIYDAQTDTSGVYLFNLDSSVLEFGDHTTQTRATLSKDQSVLSKSISFKVGLNNILAKNNKVSKGDLNGDGKVNLVDFSIMSYWYKRPHPPAQLDMNGDGIIDITDFSIMIFNWTG